jgi:uncharacterized protein
VIVVDTNMLYALADRRDKHHAGRTEWFRRNDDVLLVVPTVVAEACYLIDRYLGPAAEAAFLDSVGIGDNCAFQLAGLVDSDLRRMAELVRRYADRHPGRDRRFCDRGVRAARDCHGRHRQPPRLCQRPSASPGGAYHRPLAPSRGLPDTRDVPKRHPSTTIILTSP